MNAEPCACAGACQVFHVDGLEHLPMSQCVCFIARSGSMEVLQCVKCEAGTWHLNGVCVREHKQ